MNYQKFYQGRLDPRILAGIDEEHKKRMVRLFQNLENGNWTQKQKKRQRTSILSNIALYQILVEKGISKEKAYDLVKEYSFARAEQFHRILAALFRLPGFFCLFRFFMRKGMAGDEIWISRIRRDTSREFSMDVQKCLWFDTCRHFGCGNLCEIFCLCDHIVFGNIKKLQFERSQTLGMKGEKCDFCFHSKDRPSRHPGGSRAK